MALADLMAPEALLLTNRLRLTPIGLAVINQQDRLVDALERAVLARLQVAAMSTRASCPPSSRTTTATTATATTATATTTTTTTGIRDANPSTFWCFGMSGRAHMHWQEDVALPS